MQVFTDIGAFELQVATEPRLLFMANDINNRGQSHKSFGVMFANNDHNNYFLQLIFRGGYNRGITFKAADHIEGYTLHGILTINKLTDNGARGVFVHGNGTLWNGLEGKTLQDFDWSSYDIVNFGQADLDFTVNDAVAFSLADYGEWFNDPIIDLTEHYPAVQISTILKTIINQSGVGLNFDIPTAFENKLKRDAYLLFTQSNDIRNSNEWQQTAPFEAESVADNYPNSFIAHDDYLIEQDIQLTTDNIYWSGAEYTAPETGTYAFNMFGSLSHLINHSGTLAISTSIGGANTLNLDISIRVDKGSGYDNLYHIETVEAVSTGVNTISLATVSFDLDTMLIELEAGDKIKGQITLQYDGTGGVNGDDHRLTINATELDCRVSRYYGAGSTIEIKDILPKMGVLEFFAKVFKYLNLNVYYDDDTKQLDLVAGAMERSPIASLEVWNCDEGVQVQTDYLLEHNNDKERTPESEAITQGGDITEVISFDFSRTLIARCFRLPVGVGSIPILWKENNPLDFRSVTPEQETAGNLRIMEFDKINIGDYDWNYGGVVNENTTDAASGAAIFKELNVNDLWRTTLAPEKVDFECLTQLTGEQIHKLHNQTYFKNPVELIENGNSKGLVMLLEAEQVSGQVFKLKAKRV